MQWWKFKILKFWGKWLNEVVVRFPSALYVPHPFLVSCKVPPQPKNLHKYWPKMVAELLDWVSYISATAATFQLSPTSGAQSIKHSLEVFALELRPQWKGEVDHKYCWIQKLKQRESSEVSLGQNY